MKGLGRIHLFIGKLTHGLLDHLVIVGDIGRIDGLLKRPAIAVCLKVDSAE